MKGFVVVVVVFFLRKLFLSIVLGINLEAKLRVGKYRRKRKLIMSRLDYKTGKKSCVWS